MLRLSGHEIIGNKHMKKCFKCNEIKPLIDFYKHKQMSDGYLNKCKECNKTDVKKNYRKNINHYKDYEKKRAMTPKRIKLREDYQKTKAGKESSKKSKKKWEDNNLIKKSASIMVGNAVRDGKLKKEYFCSECGIINVRIHGHHDDYAKPLEVRWLCSKCHIDWHDENGKGKNG